MNLTPMSAIATLAGRKPLKSEWKTWVLEEPAVWETDAGKFIVVPIGFMTDFASIPFFFRWWQTGSVGPQRTAAYFHDFLYSSQDQISRKEADGIFRDVMKEISTDSLRNKIRRNLMYSALRAGGWMAWRTNQKKYREHGPSWRVLSD